MGARASYGDDDWKECWPKLWSKMINFFALWDSEQVKVTSLKLNFLQVNLFTSTFSNFNLTLKF